MGHIPGIKIKASDCLQSNALLSLEAVNTTINFAVLAFFQVVASSQIYPP